MLVSLLWTTFDLALIGSGIISRFLFFSSAVSFDYRVYWRYSRVSSLRAWAIGLLILTYWQFTFQTWEEDWGGRGSATDTFQKRFRSFYTTHATQSIPGRTLSLRSTAYFRFNATLDVPGIERWNPHFCVLRLQYQPSDTARSSDTPM